MKFKKILALAPHTDDIELGCGGLLSRFKNEAEIDVIAFTAAQPLSEGNPVDECKNAMKLVGANVEFLNFEPRVLNIQRQRVLDTLWKRNQEKHVEFFRDLAKEAKAVNLNWGGHFKRVNIWKNYNIGWDPKHLSDKRCKYQ